MEFWLNIKAMPNFYKPANFAFNAFCFICLGYVIYSQVNRYFSNRDVSTISFETFTHDKYPTYTFCLENNYIGDIFQYKEHSWNEIYVDGDALRLNKNPDKRRTLFCS